MKNKYKKKGNSEGLLQAFIIGQLAALIFSVPTAFLLWFATNKHLILWGANNAFIGSTGFMAVLGVFSFVSLFLPNLFPSLLGSIWRGLINAERWL